MVDAMDFFREVRSSFSHAHEDEVGVLGEDAQLLHG